MSLKPEDLVFLSKQGGRPFVSYSGIQGDGPFVSFSERAPCPPIQGDGSFVSFSVYLDVTALPAAENFSCA